MFDFPLWLRGSLAQPKCRLRLMIAGKSAPASHHVHLSTGQQGTPHDRALSTVQYASNRSMMITGFAAAAVQVKRAIDLRNIVTSLGPAYIKLGQALSIRPDLLSPAAMVELQKLCDKVPSFENKVAMSVIQQELGRPWHEVYADLTPDPIAAASLGQVSSAKMD